MGMSDTRREQYRARRKRGVCTQCEQPANGAALCGRCRDAQLARKRAKYAAGAREQGRRSQSEAQRAANKLRSQYYERRHRKVCVRCEQPTRHVFCDACKKLRAAAKGSRLHHEPRVQLQKLAPGQHEPAFPPRTPDQTYKRLVNTPFEIEQERAA